RAAAPHRKANRADQLIRCARGGQHALLELARGKHARAAPRAQHDLAFQHGERERQLRGRIGMGDRAAHRAFVAGLEMSDERQRLHAGCSSASAINAWMRRGVAGSSTSFTSKASAMALAMQAGTLMQLPSARPLAPKGVSGDGVSWCSISTGGISATVGTR